MDERKEKSSVSADPIYLIRHASEGRGECGHHIHLLVHEYHVRFS
jgi:hypothetical protein